MTLSPLSLITILFLALADVISLESIKILLQYNEAFIRSEVVYKLFKAGDQTPIIPFKDVVGKGAKGAPEQIGKMASNRGVTFEPDVVENVWEVVGPQGASICATTI